MAVTVTRPNAIVDDTWGRHRVTVLRVQLDSVYTAGGEDLDLRQYAPNGDLTADPVFVAVSVEGAAAEGYVVHYDPVNRKVIAFWVDTTVDGAPLAEVTAATDLSGVFVRVLVVF